MNCISLLLSLAFIEKKVDNGVNADDGTYVCNDSRFQDNLIIKILKVNSTERSACSECIINFKRQHETQWFIVNLKIFWY